MWPFMINAGVTKATKNHEVHNAFLFVMRHPPSAAEASGGGTRYSFSARGRQSKGGRDDDRKKKERLLAKHSCYETVNG